jgi:hypothetical protein
MHKVGFSILAAKPDQRVYSQMVTPAIPTHSCKICSQMTNCTLLAICKSLFPLPTSIDQ